MTRGTLIIAAAGAVLTIGVGVALWFRFARTPEEDQIGFLDYVKNPSYRDRMSQANAERDDMIQQLSELSSEELVAMLLEDDDPHIVMDAIEVTGTRSVPALIDALSKPEFIRAYNAKAQEKMHVLETHFAPVCCVLECLAEFAPSEAAGPATRFIDHENEEIRQKAAILLGVIGTDSTIDPLAKALTDTNGFVRDYALMGIMRADEADRLSPTFRRELFDVVRGNITKDDMASECLLKLDRERASRVLTASENMTPDRGGLHRTLRALREANVQVELDVLLTLIDAVEPNLDEYPNDYVASEALRLLAQHNSDNAKSAIVKATGSSNKAVRENACLALAELQGLPNPIDVAFTRLEKVGWEGLTEPQRNVLAVRILIDEVNNGGFSQYFVNSSGDHWQEAMAGLTAIGADEDPDLLRKAVAYFGEKGPDTNNEKRHHELARVVRQNGDLVFDPLEDVFYEDKHGRDSLLLEYLISHREDFGNG